MSGFLVQACTLIKVIQSNVIEMFDYNGLAESKGSFDNHHKHSSWLICHVVIHGVNRSTLSLITGQYNKTRIFVVHDKLSILRPKNWCVSIGM